LNCEQELYFAKKHNHITFAPLNGGFEVLPVGSVWRKSLGLLQKVLSFHPNMMKGSWTIVRGLCCQVMIKIVLWKSAECRIYAHIRLIVN